MTRFIRIEEDDSEPKLVMIANQRAVHTGNGRTYRVEEEAIAQEFGGGLVLGITIAGLAFLIFSSMQPTASITYPPSPSSPAAVIPPNQRSQ